MVSCLIYRDALAASSFDFGSVFGYLTAATSTIRPLLTVIATRHCPVGSGPPSPCTPSKPLAAEHR